MKSRMKKVIGVMLPVALSLLVSCATTPKIKTPPVEFKANLGTVGVVSASFQPEVRLGKPMGKGTAALHFAGKGALFAGEMAGRGCNGVGCAGIIVAMPLGALVGSIVGLAKGLPSNEIKQPEKTLKSYLDTVNFQETMRERFLTVARKETQSRLVPLEVEGPKTPNEELTYVSLSESGIDTVLEISVRKYEFATVSQHRGINPYLYLSLVAGIKFIRVADGKVLYSETFVDQWSNYLKFSDWAANDAEPFRKELDHAFQYLAGRMVDRLTGIQTPVDPPPAEELQE